MPDTTPRRRRTPSSWFIVALLLAVPVGLFAQGGRGGGAPAAPAAAKAAAPVDLTGYWVSIVTEDWIERMSPDSPPSGTRGRGGGGAPAAPRWGSLNVVTTNMSGGYLLSSRSSYSANAVLTENFTRHTDFGTDYFTVAATVQDGPQTRVTSSTFKKEPNGAKF